jgi:hypothetical protein
LHDSIVSDFRGAGIRRMRGRRGERQPAEEKLALLRSVRARPSQHKLHGVT